MPPIPAELAALAAIQYGYLSTAQVRAAGVSPRTTRTLLDRRAWAQVARGVYDTLPDARPAPSWDERHRRAAWRALLVGGPDSIPVGTSALALLCVEGLPARPTPETTLPGGASATSRGGVLLRQYDAGMRCVLVGGRLVAAPEWALAQAVPHLDRDSAVAAMDSALHRELLDEDGLAYAHDLARRRRGVLHTHDWWALADRRSESPLETATRLRCIDGKVAPDELQIPVADADGVVIGFSDLGWRQRSGRWLFAECDGRYVHELPNALLHDRHRQNTIVTEADADVLRFTFRDLRPSTLIPSAIARHLARGR